MRFTEKQIQTLLRDKKIRAAFIPEKSKNYSADKNVTIAAPRSKGIIWLDLNLQYWCNERSLQLLCAANKNELQFDPERKWRFDYAIPALKIAVEYEGGIFMQRSGHNSHTGIQRDVDKYTRAQVLGWQVIRVTAKNYTTVLKTLNELLKVGRE
jgi:hypothetical protein